MYVMRFMEITVSHEYEIEMCIDELICTPLELSFPVNFKLESLDIEAADDDTLAHICSCIVSLDDATVYNGLVGGGFSITLDLETVSKLKIIPDGKLLNNLLDKSPVCKVVVTGSYFAYGEPSFESEFSDAWC
jgi:hypothetical protein